MSVATSTAIAIGMGAASAASSVAAAKIQSNAAKKAQAAQQTATDQALKVQQDTSAPYRQLGQQGINQLQALGAPQPYTQQFRAPGGGPQSNGYQAFNPGQQTGPPPTLGGIGQMGQPGGQPPQGGPPPPQGMGGQAPPQMVTLQAPDGSTRQFPAMDAQRVMMQAKAAGHELRQVN
jgi:hypothetical protein